MQNTIRGVPPAVDAVLRERSHVTGRSLNELVTESLAEAVGIAMPRKRRNFDGIAGTWIEDKAFDEAIAAQDQIDWDMWSRGVRPEVEVTKNGSHLWAWSGIVTSTSGLTPLARSIH